MPSFICTPIDGSFHSQSFVKVPDAYTAVEELDEQALIRSKCKKADPSSIEENCFELYEGYYGIFFTDKSTLPQKIFKGTYHSMDEIIDEFKEKLEDYLPKDFNWKAHIGFIQYAIYA